MVRQSGNGVDLVGEEWWCLADSLAKEWQHRFVVVRMGVVGLGLAVKVGIYEEWIEPIRRGKAVMDGKCVDGLGPMCNGEAV